MRNSYILKGSTEYEYEYSESHYTWDPLTDGHEIVKEYANLQGYANLENIISLDLQSLIYSYYSSITIISQIGYLKGSDLYPLFKQMNLDPKQDYIPDIISGYSIGLDAYFIKKSEDYYEFSFRDNTKMFLDQDVAEIILPNLEDSLIEFEDNNLIDGQFSFSEMTDHYFFTQKQREELLMYYGKEIKRITDFLVQKSLSLDLSNLYK